MAVGNQWFLLRSPACQEIYVLRMNAMPCILSPTRKKCPVQVLTGLVVKVIGKSEWMKFCSKLWSNPWLFQSSQFRNINATIWSLSDFLIANHHTVEALKKVTKSYILICLGHCSLHFPFKESIIKNMCFPKPTFHGPKHVLTTRAIPFTNGFPEHYLQALILNDNKKWESLLSMLPFLIRKKYIQRLKVYMSLSYAWWFWLIFA